ncbi:hypothetical protein TH66_00160 [Carbonactinospora thermoautotrophica]|uniref:Uncharacterized protein n=1 Tax=Carbonactinospora thermoautotrophica TaxID=1469144 RepID=A0A132N7L8_9ACTN|nr:hypothetical protein [Carbonactinospora thermoautotrophica]KWX04633.1 hypothetical protein TR74_24235 [Carbonactinospora thermoautotrophica]KWX05967.1 hypothetical protein TH66_00160 [Carbonactinospora thermoautotrophica]
MDVLRPGHVHEDPVRKAARLERLEATAQELAATAQRLRTVADTGVAQIREAAAGLPDGFQLTAAMLSAAEAIHGRLMAVADHMSAAAQELAQAAARVTQPADGQ